MVMKVEGVTCLKSRLLCQLCIDIYTYIIGKAKIYILKAIYNKYHTFRRRKILYLTNILLKS